MVRRHEVDRLRGQHARTVEHPPVQEHLAEPRVVARRGDGAAAAAIELPRHGGVGHLVLGARIGMRRQRLGDPRSLVGGNEEGRVGHVQRAVDTLGERLGERLAAHDLHHAPEDVGREAVLPTGARLVEERGATHALDELVHRQRERGCVRGFGIHLVDLGGPPVTVGETGRVAHQVLDRHRALGGRPFQADPLILERGNVFRHRIREDQPAFLEERQCRHRDDRLRHRRDPEDRIRRHRRPGRFVEEARRASVRDASLADHDDDGAGDPPTLHVGLQDLPDALETLGGQPHLLGLRRRQLGCEERARQEGQAQDDGDRH
jgi:hypothetical protein